MAPDPRRRRRHNALLWGKAMLWAVGITIFAARMAVVMDAALAGELPLTCGPFGGSWSCA